MNGPEIADQQFTIEKFLERSSRPRLPLGRGFLQGSAGNNRPVPGPLSKFVRRGRGTALEQYLLLHAFASNGDEGFDVRLPAAVWGRAIGGHFDPKTGVVEDAALHAVSRNWRLLCDLRLVKTERVGRQVRATLLADDGSGEDYRHVGEGKKGQKLDGPGYLQLPYEYWRQGWHRELSLAAKATLLIALSHADGFSLPYKKFPPWYGISAASGERGLCELRDRGLLHRERHRRRDAESPVGFADVYHYELVGPFGPCGHLSKLAPPRWIGSKPKLEKSKQVKPKRGGRKAKRPRAVEKAKS
jgi:hypothetical protein